MVDASLHKKIVDLFSSIQDVLVISDNSSLKDVNQLLRKYRDNIIQKRFSLIKENSNGEKYHQSIFHFLQYFISVSKISFILPFDSTLFFGSILGRKNHLLQLSTPIFLSNEQLLQSLKNLFSTNEFKSLFTMIQNRSILVRDIPFNMKNYAKQNKTVFPFTIQQVKEIHYYTYDIQKTISLQGQNFSNIRWHLNKFNNGNHTIKIIENIEHETPLLHLIGAWRKHAIDQKGFSFTDMRSDKLCAKLISNTFEESLYYRILSIDGKVASFHYGYPIGFSNDSSLFAHTVGITDPYIPHLSEYAQMDFWNYLWDNGFLFVNDGPSWRNSLETYKKKYRPIKKTKQYWTTISL